MTDYLTADLILLKVVLLPLSMLSLHVLYFFLCLCAVNIGELFVHETKVVSVMSALCIYNLTQRR